MCLFPVAKRAFSLCKSSENLWFGGRLSKVRERVCVNVRANY